MKTLAAILVELKKDLEIDYIELPKINNHQLIVKILYTAVCGTQISEINGLKGEDNWLPHLLGHEAIAEVLEVGKEVKKVKQNDLVLVSWLDTQGINAGGTKYKFGSKTVNAGPVTTFQEISVVSENKVLLSPSKKNLDKCCLLGCAIPTGYGMITNITKKLENKKLLIMGAGGIGLNSCIAAKESMAEEIIMLDNNSKKNDIIQKFGSNKVINNFLELKVSYKNYFDFIIDASGNLDLMQDSLVLLKPKGGKLIIAGNAPFGSKLQIEPSFFNQGKSIIGTWGGDTFLDNDIENYYKIFSKNIELYDYFVSSNFSLENINSAIKKFQEGKIIRPIIKICD